MKATIDANGVLNVEAESGLETYALNKWSQDALQLLDPLTLTDLGLGPESGVFRGSKLIIFYDTEKVGLSHTTQMSYSQADAMLKARSK